MLLSLALIALGLLFFLLKRNYSYWKDRGVPGPDPVYIFGNIGSTLIGRKSLADCYTEIYRKYDGYPFVGLYRMFTPCLLIREPELIKNIVVKDFKHFQNNDIDLDKDVDRIFARNPFVLKGIEWKTQRAQLTSCLTSGKIKAMYPMLEEVSNRMLKYIEKQSTNGSAILESREVSVRYTLDNVAACVFGLEGHCFDEDYSMFRKLADDLLAPGSWQSFKASLLLALPSLATILKVRFIKEEVEDQLIGLVRDTLEQRRKNNIVRNDFLESVQSLFKSSDTKDNELNMTAHAASFFTDGYETSSRVMSFVLFELAAHPNCQKKLREEINKQCEKSNGKLNYEVINEMPYLDACINESLRKNPFMGQLFKTCTEKYTYTCTDPAYNNLTVTVDKDMCIVLPVAGLQTDEKHWRSPQEYIPERFLDKSDFNKYCFLPFGEGPRTCLGFRFGMTQIKLGVAQLIKNFELSVNSKTQLPLKFDNWFIMLHPIGGLWLDFKKIKEV